MWQITDYSSLTNKSFWIILATAAQDDLLLIHQSLITAAFDLCLHFLASLQPLQGVNALDSFGCSCSPLLLEELLLLRQQIFDFPWLQQSRLHLLNQHLSLRAAQQTLDILKTGTKATSTNACTPSVALRALNKLIAVLCTLAAECTPFACAATHIAWSDTDACTLKAFVFQVNGIRCLC
jgi:hypothetical protein